MWSYSGNPKANTTDYVRYLIGDTLATDPLLQDEEIKVSIDETSNLYGAAARCCEAIEAKYARQADAKIGPTTVYASQRAIAYSKLASKFRRMSSARSMAVQGDAVIATHPPIFTHDIMSDK